MDDIFDLALDTLASSPLGDAGVLTPPSGPAVPCTLIGLRAVDPALGFAEPGARAEGFKAELRRTEFPTEPEEGSLISVPARGLTLRQHGPVRVMTHSWELDLYAVV